MVLQELRNDKYGPWSNSGNLTALVLKFQNITYLVLVFTKHETKWTLVIIQCIFNPKPTTTTSGPTQQNPTRLFIKPNPGQMVNGVKTRVKQVFFPLPYVYWLNTTPTLNLCYTPSTSLSHLPSSTYPPHLIQTST